MDGLEKGLARLRGLAARVAGSLRRRPVVWLCGAGAAVCLALLLGALRRGSVLEALLLFVGALLSALSAAAAWYYYEGEA